MIIFCLPYIFWEILKYNIYLSDFKNMIKNICIYISKVNIFYIKIFQWFTYNITKDEEINKDLYTFFSQYTNSVPYQDCDIDYDSIQLLIQNTNTNNDNFTINMKPINTGTIALVFEGYLNDKKIVIKVLRNNIRKQLNNFYNDMENIGNCINFFKKIEFLNYIIPLFSFLNTNILSEIVSDCKEEFLLQLDLINEANNIEKFQSYYNDCKSIKIPHVYKKYTLTNKNVLVMEYITGHKIIENSPQENLIYLEIVHKFILSCYFFKNIFHSDLHLGNVFFIKNEDEDTKEFQYKLGIIDFGLVGYLDSVHEQDLLYDVMVSYSENNPLKLINSIFEYLEVINKLKFDDSFREKIYELSKDLNIFKSSSSTITHYEIITFIQLLQKNNLKINKRLSFLLLSVVSQCATINKLKENTVNLNLNLLIKKIVDNLLK
jgi:predicted unusual protein kinase regulating ubiquinone biosynthesis (AarF/ABC1/UbiB family)